MSKFYTYCYLDENNIPYYIGKGSGRRAYHVHDNVSVPPKDRILILKQNLLEDDAFNHEQYMIFLLGKKSNGGLLENITDGGKNNNNLPSWTGKTHSEESKKKISKSVSGEKHPFYGKSLTEEHKNKIKETKRKNPQYFSEESKQKMSISKKQYWENKKLERHGES
jgi:hypothetical protein